MAELFCFLEKEEHLFQENIPGALTNEWDQLCIPSQTIQACRRGQLPQKYSARQFLNDFCASGNLLYCHFF